MIDAQILNHGVDDRIGQTRVDVHAIVVCVYVDIVVVFAPTFDRVIKPLVLFTGRVLYRMSEASHISAEGDGDIISGNYLFGRFGDVYVAYVAYRYVGKFDRDFLGYCIDELQVIVRVVVAQAGCSAQGLAFGAFTAAVAIFRPDVDYVDLRLITSGLSCEITRRLT